MNRIFKRISFITCLLSQVNNELLVTIWNCESSIFKMWVFNQFGLLIFITNFWCILNFSNFCEIIVDDTGLNGHFHVFLSNLVMDIAVEGSAPGVGCIARLWMPWRCILCEVRNVYPKSEDEDDDVQWEAWGRFYPWCRLDCTAWLYFSLIYKP